MKLFNKISILICFIPMALSADVPWHTISFSILDNSNSATFHMQKYYFGIHAERMSYDGTVLTQDWRYFEETVYEDDQGFTHTEQAHYGWVVKNAGVSVSAWLLTPRFGKRFQLKSAKKIHSFADIEGYLTIPFIQLSVKAEDDETSDEIIDTSDIENIEDNIDDILDFSGFKFSYGITYQINEQLSFSTAFGYNHSFANFDYYDVLGENRKDNISISLDGNEGYSFTSFSINFTF